MLIIRPFKEEDAGKLLSLFKETVRKVNSRDYSPAQIAAWASDEIDPMAWQNRFVGRLVFVAEHGGVIAGFAELEHNCESPTEAKIDRFYVASNFQRLGVGSALMNPLIRFAQEQDLQVILVDASISARPFFERHGFQVIASQTVICRGASFLNYKMSRHISLVATGRPIPDNGLCCGDSTVD